MGFHSGLTIVTGETGAGKSILLDALSLVLGKRADQKVVRDASEKCVVEAEFQIAPYHFRELFEALDLDYEDQTILRREILPNGKSRAFVNDTPVSLQQLQSLGILLIDIHSQFDTQSLFSEQYQLELIDTLAHNEKALLDFQQGFKEYSALQSEWEALKSQKEQAAKEWDYHHFLFTELQSLQLSKINQQALEETFEQLNNAEEIQEVLSQSHQLLSEENIGALTTLGEMRLQLGKIKGFSKSYESLWNRINSVYIELEDISEELQLANDQLEARPDLLAEVNEKLQSLYRLQQKHSVSSVAELLEIEKELSRKVSDFESVDERIAAVETKIKSQKEDLEKRAKQIRKEREAVFPKLKQELESYLKDLGLPNAQFVFQLKPIPNFRLNGMDELSMLFSANKGVAPGPIQKMASGGELSRVMLSLKAVLAHFKNLPTIVFDEIDTGVSGKSHTKWR
ncbi:MAG: DNA repair protein RecN [Flavobacteriaceae bacterium]